MVKSEKHTSNSKFINREIAWLSFNERVLQEAVDPTNPVIERVIFLGIFSNNMDEFFKVRVASLKRLISKKKTRIEYPVEPVETLQEIKIMVGQQLKRFEEIFEWNMEEMRKNHIHLINEQQITLEQGRYIREYFHQHIRRHIYPVSINKIKTSEGLSDKSNFLAVMMHSKERPYHKEEMIIEIPVAKINRFLVLPKHNAENFIILLDDVIRYCLDDIFKALGYDTFSAYTFKFIRDAELDIDYANEDPSEFMGYLSERLKDRNTAKAVRLVHDKRMPREFQLRLQSIFNVPRNEVFDSGGRYQNKKDFMNFPRNFANPKLIYPPFTPQDVRELPLQENTFAVLRKKDIMLHYPYQSFQHVIDLVREASMDPKVLSIKMTIYRVAKDSSIMNALLNAARNGKKVSVFMEVLARFDEENNLDWVRRLEEEKVEVYPIIPGVKVHGKLIVICRKEGNAKRYYAAIGTGNPNEATAKIYVDKQLLTSNPKLTLEANKIFKHISKPQIKQTYKELLVAPNRLRSEFEKLIDVEIANAKRGKEAWIKACFNNLADASMVEKLYAASKANVKIQLVIRGICILRAGVPKLSENIEIVSIVDRFLEHSRVFIFANAGKPKFFIGSADWMTRNLDYRIEVATPIYDKEIQADLLHILNLQLKDNTHARSLEINHINEYIQRPVRARKIRSQEAIYAYLKAKYS
ncbi:MAG: polyphosphate kinase 1 [Bacteroidales bacterium]